MELYYSFSSSFGLCDIENSYNVNLYPYYVRCTLLVKPENWSIFKKNFLRLKRKHGIPTNESFKWEYLWFLRNTSNGKIYIPSNIFLLNKSYHDLEIFIQESLLLINQLENKDIIYSFNKNRTNKSNCDSTILKKHVKKHIELINYLLTGKTVNKGIISKVLYFILDDNNISKAGLDNNIITKSKTIEYDIFHLKHNQESIDYQIMIILTGIFFYSLKNLNDPAPSFMDSLFQIVLSANGIDYKNIHTQKHFVELTTKTEAFYRLMEKQYGSIPRTN